jgi:hypothetical protein
MRIKIAVVSMCLLVARTAVADTLVTWQSTGTIFLSEYLRVSGTGRTPPVGTPYQLLLTFDPDAMFPTVLGVPGANCFTVPVAGSLDLGGYTYGVSGQGFTHGKLPGLTCSPGFPETQFLTGAAAPPDTPWSVRGFLELSFTDALVRDAFPATPTTTHLFLQWRDNNEQTFLVQGRGPLTAVSAEQPTPVPEPGTLSLFGLGIAIGMKRWRGRDTQS